MSSSQSDLTDLSARINDQLPQTQCGQCGFNGCRPYAEAIASGVADINQCPPGGDEGILALAKILDIAPKPLNLAFGSHKPIQIAVIIEQDCIGCVKCIQACPVDAIIGASKMLHTIISDECTGCELCLPPCPVNCIQLVPTGETTLTAQQKYQKVQLSKRRYEARLARTQKELEARQERAAKQKALLLKLNTSQTGKS